MLILELKVLDMNTTNWEELAEHRFCWIQTLPDSDSLLISWEPPDKLNKMILCCGEWCFLDLTTKIQV
uniref:Uncharacterized protein n=1 Tax=Arion vulgaris TaxID=1028688 RepID=A0A0B6XYS9_9EUPU